MINYEIYEMNEIKKYLINHLFKIFINIFLLINNR